MYKFTITTSKGVSYQFKSKTVTDVTLGQLRAELLYKMLKKAGLIKLFNEYYATSHTPVSILFGCSISREWIDGRSKEAHKLQWYTVEFYLNTDIQLWQKSIEKRSSNCSQT